MSIVIVGAAGYTGGELIRLLVRHPNVELKNIHAISSSHAGQHVSAVHTDLLGIDLTFSDSIPSQHDVVFLCMAHGSAKQWMFDNTLHADCIVIDLSMDHRLDAQWVYGIAEINRQKLISTKRIANPGCFASAIELALLPLAEKQMLKGDVVVTAITGSTGAGQAPSQTSHFSWRANNVEVYKAFKHQHLAEIETVLGIRPLFIPQRGPFARGIMATCVVQCNASNDALHAIYSDRYSSHPFVHTSAGLPDLKRVVGTNMCAIGMEVSDGHAVIVSVLDNLLKGASGVAVQNMNLAMGWNETAGLDLRATGY